MIELSNFGRKFIGDIGILNLMDDLGKAVAAGDSIMMGGGNPSQIPAVQAIFRDRMLRMLDGDEFERVVGNYDGPAGSPAFRRELVSFFRQEYGWDISERNIAFTNGSQSAFFFLFNMLSGEFADGHHKRILLPLAPEYIGYEDVGIAADSFISYKPQIEISADRTFKYFVDFDALEIDEAVGAICVSRPTNPTGNVLTEDEISRLSAIALRHGVPLIVDNAYGTPFPSIIFTDAKPRWEPHIIMCMSLSKLGLPGVRTGIVIAHEQIIEAMMGMSAVLTLAPGGFGGALVLDAVRSRQILEISHNIVRPHYQKRSEYAQALLHAALAGTNYYIHKSEGAIFLWLWFKDMPITSAELYKRLKQRGVIIVPGHYFFPGLADDGWRHRHECIRLNYAGEAAEVAEGIRIIGEEVQRAYAE
jgi:valine--pyruvate aminotransferase